MMRHAVMTALRLSGSIVIIAGSTDAAVAGYYLAAQLLITLQQ